jgi:hypothetical protein
VLVARGLIVGHRLLEGAPAGIGLVQRPDAQLGVPEGVLDPLRRDEVLVVSGVAHQRPPRPEGLAEISRHGHAGEPFLAARPPKARREVRRQVDHLEEVAFDVRLVRLELRIPWKRRSGGWAVTAQVRLRAVPGGADVFAVLVGVELTRWTGLTKDQLDLPATHAYGRPVMTAPTICPCSSMPRSTVAPGNSGGASGWLIGVTTPFLSIRNPWGVSGEIEMR